MNIFLRFIFYLILLVEIYDPRVHSYKLCPECNLNLIVANVDQCKTFCALYMNDMHPVANEKSWKLKLTCRSNTSLSILVDSDLEYENLEAIIFHVHKSNAIKASASVYYLQDQLLSSVDFANLGPNTSYDISMAAYNKNMQMIGRSKDYQFDTLPSAYIPGKPRNITLQNITNDESNPKAVKAQIRWEPAEDKSCNFQVVSIVRDSMDVNTVNSDQGIFYSEISNVEMGTNFKVGIGSKGLFREELEWKKFTIPSCLEIYRDNLTVCAPPEPQGLSFTLSYFYSGSLSMEITWDTPKLLPDYYELSVLVLSTHMKLLTSKYNVSREKNRFVVKNFDENGLNIEANLKAHSKGGFSTATASGSLVKMKQIALDNFVMFIVPLGFAIVIVFLILFATYLTFKIERKEAEWHSELSVRRKRNIRRTISRYLKTQQQNDGFEDVLL